MVVLLINLFRRTDLMIRLLEGTSAGRGTDANAQVGPLSEAMCLDSRTNE